MYSVHVSCACTCVYNASFLYVRRCMSIESCTCLSHPTRTRSQHIPIPDLGMEPGSCLCDLESHVDEHSLAVIAQNRGEIVRRLSQRRDKDSISNFDTSGLGQGEIELGHGGMESGRGGMESRHTDTHVPVPTLDRVLLELNSILRNKLCSEKDLIQAIENQLNIQLRPQDDRVLSQPREVANKDSEEYQIEDVISEVDDITVTSSVEEGAGLVKTHSYENLKEWLDTTDSNVSRNQSGVPYSIKTLC